MVIAKPVNEEGRIAALEKYAILDTDPEQTFDDLTLLASFACKTPVALISLVDEDRQWFKSRVGIDASETSRDIAFCSTAILQSDVFVVPDALLDERFRDNPLVASDPHIRFYAGAPLINEDGFALGTLCVVDRTPRELAPDQREALKALSRLVLSQLEFRRNLILLKEALTDRTKEEHERQQELLHVQETLMRVMGLRQLSDAGDGPTPTPCFPEASLNLSASASACQRKVEMSGFSPDRNVRFHGLLQGWFAGTWYLGLILFWGLGVCSASPSGLRPPGLADGRSGSGQARRCR